MEEGKGPLGPHYPELFFLHEQCRLVAIARLTQSSYDNSRHKQCQTSNTLYPFKAESDTSACSRTHQILQDNFELIRPSQETSSWTKDIKILVI